MNDLVFHSDEPVLDDYLQHGEHIKRLGNMIQTCKPPFVLGIHGDWGAGKTSFLKKLHVYLAAQDSGYEDALVKGKVLWGNDWGRQKRTLETIWFDAWRYQFDNNPIIALLHEIRTHFTWRQKLVGKTGKLSFAALMSLEGITKWVGAQPGKVIEADEKWERERLEDALPSEVCREQLNYAISTILPKGKDRLVIFIDDLDRCSGQVAFRLLETIKIYLSIPSCVFVLGLDWLNVQRAVAAEFRKNKIVEDERESMLYAKDYLSKLCQMVEPLPLLTDSSSYLNHLTKASVFQTQFDGKDNSIPRWLDIAKEFNLLPQNPRKIKAFINSFGLYLNQLRPLLEESNIDLNYKFALIIAYLKLNETAIFRLLEAENSFWERLVEFCSMGSSSRESDHEVFDGRILADSVITSDSTVTPEPDYKSAFRDPADERVFRPARLIRNYVNFEGGPSDNMLQVYVNLRKVK